MQILNVSRDRRVKRANVFAIDTMRNHNQLVSVERGLENTIDLSLFDGRKVIINAHFRSWGTTPYRYNMTDLNLVKYLSNISRENGAKGVFLAVNTDDHIFDLERFNIATSLTRWSNIKTYLTLNLRDTSTGIGSPFTLEEFAKEWMVLNVTMPKSHNYLGFSGCLENLAFGMSSRNQRMEFYNANLEYAVVKANKYFRQYNNVIDIIDGRWGQEGFGPYFGKGIDLGFMIFGTDPVAVDAKAAKLTGFEPREIPLIELAEEEGLGHIFPHARGDKIKIKRMERSPRWGLKILGENEDYVAVYHADDKLPIGYRRHYHLMEIDGELRYSPSDAFIQSFPEGTKKAEIMAEMFLSR